MRSFTGRIVIGFAILVTLTVALLLAFGGWVLSREAISGIDLLNRAEFMEIRDRLGAAPSSLSAADIDQLVRPHTQVDAALYFFQIRDQQGRVLFRSANLAGAVLPQMRAGLRRETEEVPGIGSVRVSEFMHGPLHLEIASAVGPADRVLSDYVQVSMILLGIVAIASIGLGWGFARIMLRPVRAIHDTAARIRADNLGQRIPLPPGGDELARLVALLNRMFDGLEASFQQIRRFTADASHELKTPLALIRLNGEKLRTKLAEDPETGGRLDDMLEEVDHLRRMIDSLLFLARVESGTFSLQTSEIDAGEFLEDFSADAAALAEEAGVHFAVSGAGPAPVRCEPTLVRQLLLNLTANALRVSPRGSVLELVSAVHDGWWFLTLRDEGPGLPPENLERIFERFVQFSSGAPGARRPEGQGLGLAICRSIATVHGGDIAAENRIGRTGLQVHVRLQCGVGRSGSRPVEIRIPSSSL